MKIKQQLANQIWNILVETCGASESGRQDFVIFAETQGITEYRFMGSLGFGGKFWADRFKVTCYPEDSTTERLLAIDQANRCLEALKGETHELS